METRIDLYNAVWSEPMVHVAAKLGLSDVGLAKLCRRLKVPVPGRGYWAKLKAGGKVKKEPLPDQGSEVNNPHELRRLRHAFEKAMNLVSTKERVRENFGVEPSMNSASNPVQIHPLVSASMPWIERSGLGVFSLRRKQACISIAVSAEQLVRAARVMSLAIYNLEARSIQVEVTKPVEASEAQGNRTARDSQTVAKVHAFQIPFEIFEEEEMVEIAPAEPPKRSKSGLPMGPGKPPKMEAVPTGRLVIRVLDDHRFGVRRRWADRKSVPLENQIPAFVDSVLLIGERWKQQEEEWARRQAQWDEEARLRRRETDRKEMQALMTHDLHHRAKDWLTGQEIQAFLEAFEAHQSRKGETVRPDSELAAWVAWAYLHAESMQRDAIEDLNFRRPPKDPQFPPWG